MNRFLFLSGLFIISTPAIAGVRLSSPTIVCTATDFSNGSQPEYPLIITQGDGGLQFLFAEHRATSYTTVYSQRGLIVAENGSRDMLRIIREDDGTVTLRVGTRRWDGSANSKDFFYSVQCGDQLRF